MSLTEVYLIDNEIDLAGLVEYSTQFGQVILDVETDSTSEKLAKLFGIGFCFEDGIAYYVPIRNKNRDVLWKDLDVVSKAVKKISDRKIIGHNVVYDALVIENNFGYKISDNIYADTILMKHLIDEERPFGLKEVAVKYLGPWADKAQKALYENIATNGGATSKDNLEMWKADTSVLGEYCGWDVILTKKLFDLFTKKIGEQGLSKLFYEEEVMPLYKTVTINMKRKGFHIDVPYFEKLREEITKDISEVETAIYSDISALVEEFERAQLNEEFPVKRTGNFPKALAEDLGVALPEKDGKPTLAKKEVKKLAETNPHWFYDWLLDVPSGPTLNNPAIISRIQKSLWYDKYDTAKVFNLRSNDHLGHLLFKILGEEPKEFTETGKPQIDDDYLESVKSKHPFITKLCDLKKLNKLASTYIEGILDRQIEGVMYASFLQFGTTSGRFSCTNVNLQNLPRVKEEDAELSPVVLRYTNAIKKGFVAPRGYKLVNADYSSLEPRCFAHVSNEETLRDVFRRGYDLYSAIAIDVFGLTGVSADPTAPNYLKKKYPEKRQLAKVFCLAVVYGAEAGRISKLMSVDFEVAQKIIDDYLNAYPNLQDYMNRCDFSATQKGYVTTEFGRIRHLTLAKDLYTRWGNRLLNRHFAKANDVLDTRYKLKNMMNLAKNHPIQGLASHVVNRAMIRAEQLFAQEGLDAWVCATVHDEICCVAREDHAERVKELLKEAMENTVKISVPLEAEPIIGNNWSEVK